MCFGTWRNGHGRGRQNVRDNLQSPNSTWKSHLSQFRHFDNAGLMFIPSIGSSLGKGCWSLRSTLPELDAERCGKGGTSKNPILN